MSNYAHQNSTSTNWNQWGTKKEAKNENETNPVGEKTTNIGSTKRRYLSKSTDRSQARGTGLSKKVVVE